MNDIMAELALLELEAQAELNVKDASGHEHKGKGEGGGQFTGTGAGKLPTVKIEGHKHLSKQDKKTMHEVIAASGLDVPKVRVLDDYHPEYMASVDNMTGDFDISKHAWDAKTLKDANKRKQEHWKKTAPADLRGIPYDVNPTFEGLMAHELGHYFEYTNHVPPGWTQNDEVKKAANSLSGHTHEHMGAFRKLEDVPMNERRKFFSEQSEVFADFFEAYMAGKKVPKMLGDWFSSHGAKPTK